MLKHTHTHHTRTFSSLSVKKACSPLRQTRRMQRACWRCIGDNNMTTHTVLPQRLRARLGEAENRGLCGPARQKYFHMSDKVDKDSSARENCVVHRSLHITRRSVLFSLSVPRIISGSLVLILCLRLTELFASYLLFACHIYDSRVLATLTSTSPSYLALLFFFFFLQPASK